MTHTQAKSTTVTALQTLPIVAVDGTAIIGR
jgi:hypothetical protein